MPAKEQRNNEYAHDVQVEETLKHSTNENHIEEILRLNNIEEEMSKEDYENMQAAYKILKDDTKEIHLRTRALFILRNTLHPLSAQIICEVLNTEKYENILLKHEMAYVLGQMKQPNSIKYLIDNLLNGNQDPITRHECAEALGNFKIEVLDRICKSEYKKSIMEILEPLLNHPILIISESCILAIGKLNSNRSDYLSPFHSYDPTLPAEKYDDVFLNDEGCLYERYRIMFYLRNLNNDFAIEKLSEGFKSKSDLFRHELGFVMGQMKNPKCLDVLEDIVMNENEKDIVRHEAIEAIGSIGTKRSFEILERFRNIDIQILRESALVGLDITSDDFFVI